jgi:hypothetical protein
MRRLLLGILRAIAIVGLSVAMLFVWFAYQEAYSLHVGFGRYMADALPIYALKQPFPISAIPGATDRLGLAAIVAALGVGVVGLSIARRWPTAVCLGLALVAVFGTNVLVARVPRDESSLYAPFSRIDMEYFGDVRLVKDKPLKFIADYPKLNNRYSGMSHHAGTHPPGGVLFLWIGDKMLGPPAPPPQPKPTALQRLFGASDDDDRSDPYRGIEAASWCAISVTALAVIPAYVLAATIGGAAAARRLLPLYIVTPNLILFGATCMDGVFLTFTLTALAAGFLAMRRWSIVRPIAAGILLWVATFFTFSAIAVPTLMGIYALCIAVTRPREAARMLARAAIVGIVFIIAQLAAQHWLGYDLRATVDAAMKRDLSGVRISGYESFRIWWTLSLGNVLAFAFGSGLVVTATFLVALVTWRGPRRARAFSIAFPLCILALAMSTLFSMEVERVWLFLTPAGLIVATRAFRGLTLWLLIPAMAIAQALMTEWYFFTYW